MTVITVLVITILASRTYPCYAAQDTENVTEKVSEFFSWSPGPLGLAIARDGKTAYLSFCFEDSLLVVDLSTFTTVKSIDVSSAGSMLCSGSAVLSQDESKLFVVNMGPRNLMIVNTKSNEVEEVLPIDPNGSQDCISADPNETAVYIASSSGLYIINTLDNSYARIFIPSVQFESVKPSIRNPGLLYCIGRLYPEVEPQHVFFTFNLSSNAVERTSILPNEALPPYAPMRFTINSEETTAYFGAWALNIQGKGVGNFNVFDLNSFQLVCSTPIECGVADFAVNEKTGKIYIIGFWSGGGAPNVMYVREWDMSSNKVTKEIFVAPSGDQRAIVIDPVDPNYFYMTEGDFNLLRKVHIPTGKEVQTLKFNKEDVAPWALFRGDDVGYIICDRTSDIYKLNLSSGQLLGRIPMPSGAKGGGGYYRGRLYLPGDKNSIYSINPSDGSLIETFNIDRDIKGRLTFFNDRMAAIDHESGTMIGKHLFLFDARNMTILKSIDLPPEPTGNEVIASPDGSKLYLARGYMVGTSVITIFNSSTLDVINTIELPAEIGGITSFSCCDFDEEGRIAYFGGVEQIYEIHMDTDELAGILDTWDVYELGKARWAISSPVGIFLSSSKDKLFVISNDAHSMATYDLANSCWMTKITNLKGYFQSDADCSPDRRYLYTINQKSDSITMVDLTSGEVVRVIVLRVPTTVSISLSPMTTITEGNSIIVSGSINPTLTGKTVTLTYRKPDGSTLNRTITTGSDGSYSDSYTPDATGLWSVTASWEGDSTHSGATSSVKSFMINLKPFIETPLGIATVGLGITVVVVAAVVFVLRKRRA